MGRLMTAKKTNQHNKSQKLVQNKTVTKAVSDFNNYMRRVEKKAFELYEKRGRVNGHDCEDWSKAQQLVEQEIMVEK